MKTAVIYYSMSGNTAHTAERIAKETGADLIRIEPEKAYPDKGLRKFLHGGKSAAFGEKPPLKPYAFDAEAYEQVVIGFPVWASNMAPPIRTFVAENREKLAGKQIAAFACQSGNGAEKAFRKLQECLDDAELKATLILIDPVRKPKPENDGQIAAFGRELA